MPVWARSDCVGMLLVADVPIPHTTRGELNSGKQGILYIFNCNWVATRWQLFSTYIHTNNTGNVTKQTIQTTQKHIEQHNNYEECGPCPVFAGFTLFIRLKPSGHYMYQVLHCPETLPFSRTVYLFRKIRTMYSSEFEFD